MDFLTLLVIFVAESLGDLMEPCGGTSIITIPLLIFLGVPPHTAIERTGCVTGIGSQAGTSFIRKD
jgi:uncharacterized membrane protein YfcA